MSNQDNEQTLVLIKPDALKNSLTGYVLSLLSEYHSGLRFNAAKIVKVSRMLASEHYAEYISGELHYKDEPWKRRVIALVYQGKNAVKEIRALCGPTNPHSAREERPGCIRSLGTIVPLYDDRGQVIGDRMDNLIHASADLADAEREIKLWFTPTDIPPAMRNYPVERVKNTHYYLGDGKLLESYEDGAVCIVAPGNIVWESDMEALRLISKGKDAHCSLECVAAKYLINSDQEN
jgi:nucleoside-diphosphate kinase